jgi:dTDP-glucose 4,6-dehydratase
VGIPEELVPLLIAMALAGADLPVYGKAPSPRLAVRRGSRPGAACGVRKRGVRPDLQCRRERREAEPRGRKDRLCDYRLRPRATGQSYATQITYVAVRPGHDKRYTIDASRIKNELRWEPSETFETGIEKTVA